MIQFRRGTTQKWAAADAINSKLASGQPGYDKDKHKLKVGDGTSKWSELPYASGLFEQEVLDSESNAKARLISDPKEAAVITYGTAAPNADTVGKLYLQQSNADHIVESGTTDGWIYQIYNSGIMKCFGTFKVQLDVTDSIEGTGLYCDNGSFKKTYPKTFTSVPAETATVHSTSGIAWVANKSTNTETSSGTYTIVSPTSINNAEYSISIHVEGMK